MSMQKKTKYYRLKQRENILSQRDSAHEQPGALKKVRRQLRKLDKEFGKA